MRVLFVTHNLSVGEGAPTSLLQAVAGLHARHGIEARVFSVLPGGLGAAYERLGIPVAVAGPERLSRLATDALGRAFDSVAEAFRDALAEAVPDLVVANTAPALPFADLAEEAGVPALAVIRESSEEHVGLAFGPPEVAERARGGLARARRTIFVSAHTESLWAARHDLAAPLVIPNGIDLAPFEAALARPRAEARAALGHPEGELLLLSVGSLNARKAQGDIVEALALLPPALWGGLRLALVGARPGAYLEALRARLAQLPPALAGRVRIEPETHDVGTWYRAADVFAFASRSESYPRVIVEAMAFGLPVVSTAVFGTKEQVVDGESGLLFPPGDVPALARHLRALLTDAPRRAALGEAAAERAWELTTHEEMVHRYAVALRRVAAEAAAQGPVA